MQNNQRWPRAMTDRLVFLRDHGWTLSQIRAILNREFNVNLSREEVGAKFKREFKLSRRTAPSKPRSFAQSEAHA